MSSADGCIVDGGPAPPANPDLWTWLKTGIDLNPSATALRALHKPPNHLANLLLAPNLNSSQQHLVWSYAQLEEAASTLAKLLSLHGVGSGDAITTFLPNSVEAAVAFWAAIQLGATFVPLDPRILPRLEELIYLINLVSSNIIIVDNSDAARQIDQALHETSSSCKIKMISNPNGARLPGWQYLSEVNGQEVATEASASKLERMSSRDAEYIALVLFTSGTTNKPKGCPQSSIGFAAGCDGHRAGQLGAWDARTRFLPTTSNFRPLYLIGSFTAWRSGGCVVLASEIAFDASSTLTTICAEEITHIFVVPSQVQRMVKELAIQNHWPDTLRYMNVTSDIVHKRILDMCKRELRVENPVSVWGMTEGTGTIQWTSPHDTVSFTSSGEGEIAGLGRILAGAKAKVCREGNHELVDWGQIGDLHVCAPNFITRYLGGGDENTFYCDEIGCNWLITGDRAKIGRDGIIYVVGRSKDIISSYGLSLLPGVLEGLIDKFEGVDKCQVLGVPHEELGEIPIAIIKAIHDQVAPSIDTLNAQIRPQLGDEYQLDATYRLEDLGFDDWPLNSSGKVTKKDLKEAVIESRAR